MRHLGGVAQLGEHLLCKQGVTGSIPVVSISVCAVGVTAVSRSFRVRWMRVSGHRVPDGCARRGVGLCQCESGSGASLDACARHGKRRDGVCQHDTAIGVQPPGHGPLFDGMSDREVRPLWDGSPRHRRRGFRGVV
jgi:hypothetical protein